MKSPTMSSHEQDTRRWTRSQRVMAQVEALFAPRKEGGEWLLTAGNGILIYASIRPSGLVAVGAYERDLTPPKSIALCEPEEVLEVLTNLLEKNI